MKKQKKAESATKEIHNLSGVALEVLMEYQNLMSNLKRKSNYYEQMKKSHLKSNYLVSTEKELIALLNKRISEGNTVVEISDTVLNSISGKKEYMEELYNQKDKVFLEIKELEKKFSKMNKDTDKDPDVYKELLERIFYKKLLAKRIIHHEFSFFKETGWLYFDEELNRNIKELKKKGKDTRVKNPSIYKKGWVKSKNEIEEEKESFNIYVIKNLYNELEELRLNKYKYDIKSGQVLYLKTPTEILGNITFSSSLKNHYELYQQHEMKGATLTLFKEMLPEFERELSKGQDSYDILFKNILGQKELTDFGVYENIKKLIIVYLEIRNKREFFTLTSKKEGKETISEIKISHKRNPSVAYLDEKKLVTSLNVFNKICLELIKNLPSECVLKEINGKESEVEHFKNKWASDESIKDIRNSEINSITLEFEKTPVNNILVDYVIKNLQDLNVFWGKQNVSTDWSEHSLSMINVDNLKNKLNENRRVFMIEYIGMKNKDQQPKEDRLRKKI